MYVSVISWWLLVGVMVSAWLQRADTVPLVVSADSHLGRVRNHVTETNHGELAFQSGHHTILVHVLVLYSVLL